MKAPIFILGHPRSGTSFVVKLIQQFTGYSSYGESHTSTLLQEIHHQINLYCCRARTELTGKELVNRLDLEGLKKINTTYFRDFYLNTYSTEGFIDKTPGAVACHGWGVVKDVFPSAVFVACVRSPVEVYESFLLKFHISRGDTSGPSPIEIAEGWVAAMSGIEALMASSFGTDLHVLSQLELRVDPKTSVKKLFRFLEIPDSNVSEAIILCSQSRDDVLTNSITCSAYKTLDQLSIAPDVAERFREICSPICSRFSIRL